MPEGPFTLKVKVNGTEISDAVQIESLVIKKEFNRIPIAKISILDGGFEESTFGTLPGTKANPGAEIEIELGYGSTTKPVFKGIVTKQALSLNELEYLIEIEARDKSIKLTSGRKNEIFQKKKDSDIIQALTQDAGISIEVDSTSVEHEEVVQYSCSNWDFMVLRAELNGMLVLCNDGDITVKKPDFSGAAVATFINGQNVIGLNLEIDSTHQYSKAKAVGWDAKEQKALEKEVTATPNETVTFGSLTSKKLSEVINDGGYELNTPVQVAQDKLNAWGGAKLIKSALNMVKGYVECEGTSKVKPGDVVEFTGFSKDFNGSLLVTAVEHILKNGEWKTVLSFGLPFSWFAEEVNDISVPSASAITASIGGLCTGIVKKIHQDPDGQYRVQVSLPVLGGPKGNLTVNARLAHLYATNGSGTFFYPEINDEVLLGFLNEDPHQPVILGMLYSSKNKAPFEPDDKNQFKGIVSRSKITMKIDDEDKILTFSTPGGNIITLDDKEKQIMLTDQNNNIIKMNQDGVTIESAKDIIMKATGDIKMEATGNVDIKATGDLKGSGLNVTLEAQTGLTAKGSATAELSASGQTTVKGAIVMIN